MAAFMPGFLLSGLYVTYIAVRCYLNPALAPAVPLAERSMPARTKARMLLTSLVPPLALIVAVLGSIFAGVAAPTEASAVGAFAATLLAIAYRTFSWQVLKETTHRTMSIIAMAMIIAIGASMFTSIFLGLGCGDVVMSLIVSVPLGRWGSFAVIMLIVFILGMFIDWIGIILVMIPIVTPIGASLGFDSLWFAMMIIINLQMSFLTPPFAYAIFFLKGICKPEWEIDTSHIIRGVLPFIGLIVLALGLCVVFPDIILWLPAKMIGR